MPILEGREVEKASQSEVNRQQRSRLLTIDFIEEDDTRLSIPRLLEQKSQLPLSFSDPFTKDIRSLSHEESYKKRQESSDRQHETKQSNLNTQTLSTH